jgi:hypothetical protein
MKLSRNAFLQHHNRSILGVISGFDRMLFRGTLRMIAHARGMSLWLRHVKVLLKDFADYVETVTGQITRACVAVAVDAGRPVEYLDSSSVSKEDIARQIAERDGIREGLVCALTCVEPCQTFDIHRNARTKHLELISRLRKCKHVYHYWIDPAFGFMHARIQTWLPLTIKVCLNGREWLARQMDGARIAYRRRENCFVQIDNVVAAQKLLNRQLRTNWPKVLNGIARQLSPAHAAVFDDPLEYYWSADQIEWATDIMFKSPQDLAQLYPRLINYAMSSLGSHDVLRFLGRNLPTTGAIPSRFHGEVVTELKERPEGLRIKHRLNGNSIKMYDKQGSNLRVETTVNDPRDFWVYRGVEGQPKSPVCWRKMRKGVADLHRHAAICQAANERYLDALASVEPSETLAQLSQRLCRPVTYKGRRVRALNPLAPEDAALLEAVSRGEFILNGFRNRDLRLLLYARPTQDAKELRSRSAATSRKLRLLRAHGLITKVPKTHRYLVTPAGRTALTALLAARAANTKKLLDAA